MSYFSHFVLFLSFSFFSCFNLASVCLKAYRPWRQKKPFGSQFQFVGFSPTQTHGWIFIPRLLHCGPLQRSTFSRPTGGARVRLSSAELTTWWWWWSRRWRGCRRRSRLCRWPWRRISIPSFHRLLPRRAGTWLWSCAAPSGCTRCRGARWRYPPEVPRPPVGHNERFIDKHQLHTNKRTRACRWLLFISLKMRPFCWFTSTRLPCSLSVCRR